MASHAPISVKRDFSPTLLCGGAGVGAAAGAGHWLVGQSGGVIENMHSTDVESTRRVRASVCAFTLKASHASMSVECLLSMTLLQGGRDSGARNAQAVWPWHNLHEM